MQELVRNWGDPNVATCRFSTCIRPAVFHVLFPSAQPGEQWEYSNLCRVHTGNALRDGAQAAHSLTPECFDTMYFPAVSMWIVRDNRCGLLVTTADPFEGWRLQDA